MTKLVGLEAITADLVRYMGSDEIIAEFAKSSTGKSPDTDALVANLVKWRHAVPFEAVQFHFNVTAPMYIMQQITRHAAFRGVAASTRYGNVQWQAVATGNYFIDLCVSQHLEKIEEHYNSIPNMTRRQREQILSGLTRSVLTSFMFTCNLRGLANFFRQRLDEKHVQHEMLLVAQAMLNELKWNNVCPVALKALEEQGWVL